MRASYTLVKQTPEAVFIVDNDIGMSVTNDAEAVVLDICQRIPGSYAKRIIYRDTDGAWGELLHGSGRFTDFAPYYGETP